MVKIAFIGQVHQSGNHHWVSIFFKILPKLFEIQQDMIFWIKTQKHGLDIMRADTDNSRNGKLNKWTSLTSSLSKISQVSKLRSRYGAGIVVS